MFSCHLSMNEYFTCSAYNVLDCLKIYIFKKFLSALVKKTKNENFALKIINFEFSKDWVKLNTPLFKINFLNLFLLKEHLLR